MAIEVKLISRKDDVLEALDQQIETALEACGQAAVGFAKVHITAHRAIDTGRLRNSITFNVSKKGNKTYNYKDDNGKGYTDSKIGAVSEEDTVYVGTNVEYAQFVENGTSRYPHPRPFIKPAASEHGDEYAAIIKRYLQG